MSDTISAIMIYMYHKNKNSNHSTQPNAVARTNQSDIKLSLPKKVMLGLGGICIIALGAFTSVQALQYFNEEPETISSVSDTQENTKNDASVNESDAGLSDEAAAEIAFASDLRNCTPRKMTFTHLLTGEKLEKEIVGLMDEKCIYEEQMPNDGLMKCRYDESRRAEAAKYYEAFARSSSFSSESDLSADGEVQSSETIDGEPIENPLNETINDGTCEITGY